MGGGGHGASYGSMSAGPSQGMPSTVQGNAIKANAVYNDQQGERYCFKCFGRTKNEEVDLFVDHFFVDRCLLMDKLVNQILRESNLSLHTFNGNNVNVQSFSRATIDEFYEELPVNTVTINTVTTSKSRSKIQSARENFRRRVKAKKKYLKAGSQRQTSQGAQNEEREEMDVDQSEDETLRQQSDARNARTAVAREMLGAVDPMKQLSQSFYRMFEETSQSASITGNPVILGVNLVGTDFLSLIKRRHIVVASKLYFNLSGPIGSSGECGMLDTGAECCIAPTHIARDLGSTIANVEDFQLFIAIGQNFEFAGVAIMKVEIEHGVKCEISFFLVDSAKKILLGQLFVAAIKMQIEYRDDGSWDGVFRDLKDPSSICTIMIVLPLKTYLRQATRNCHVRMYPRVEEASEEEYNAGN
ncbi:hypothetical protein BDZ45DRAFT_777178 [Acephala macrosclerotiorum]|nr:hypothetical protein BDZ45DRAFT_777178 [Acephala macrosclerotiorum]